MTIPESFAEAIEDFIANQIDLQMGLNGLYDDLHLQEVHVLNIRRIADWVKMQKPMAIVDLRTVERGPGPHGNEILNFTKTYPVAVFIVSDGTLSDVQRSMKTLESRFERVYRTWHGSLRDSVQNLRNEKLQAMSAGNTAFTLQHADSSSTADRYFGISVTRLTFRTSIVAPVTD